AAAGTTKLAGLASIGSQVIARMAGERGVFGLVDNDLDGRKVSKNKRLDRNPTAFCTFENGVAWARLPVTPAYREFAKELRLQPTDYQFTIEHMFSADLVEEAVRRGVYGFGKVEETLIGPIQKLHNLSEYLQLLESRLDHRRFVCKPDPATKVPFAEWIATEAERRPEILEPFAAVVSALQQKLTSDSLSRSDSVGAQ
ncbi:hypothetical protein ACFL59_15105, partial [Planctomycetota bacterium]